MRQAIWIILLLLGNLMCSLVAAPALAALNDTGIGFCGDPSTNTADCATVAADSGAFPGQDARFGRDAAGKAGKLPKVGGGEAGFDFTALNAAGQSTTPSSGVTPHPCVRDNVTGLVWEVKTADDGFRDKKWFYTWYNSVNNYGGNAGTASGGVCKTAGRCDTEKYVADVNASALCDYTDWRMPTVKELEGIAHFGRTDPAIDPTYFPNIPSQFSSQYFWSGSPSAISPNEAWEVHFYNGSAVSTYRSGGKSVRLVRGGR